MNSIDKGLNKHVDNTQVTCESFIDMYYKCLKTCKDNPQGAATQANKKCAWYFKSYKMCNHLCKNDINNCRTYLDLFVNDLIDVDDTIFKIKQNKTK